MSCQQWSANFQDRTIDVLYSVYRILCTTYYLEYTELWILYFVCFTWYTMPGTYWTHCYKIPSTGGSSKVPCLMWSVKYKLWTTKYRVSSRVQSVYTLECSLSRSVTPLWEELQDFLLIIKRFSLQCCAQCSVVLCSLVLCSVVLCSLVLYSAAHSTVQCSLVQWRKVLKLLVYFSSEQPRTVWWRYV